MAETHFGFKQVDESEKARKVAEVFHSVANRYFLPYALAIKYWAGPEFWSAVGGSLLVGAVYWFVYLRRPPRDQFRTMRIRRPP